MCTASNQPARESQSRTGKVREGADSIFYRTTHRILRKEEKMENTRTLAFQVPEEMFQRIKDYLTAESERVGRKISQREFILGLIENALEQPEENQSEYN